MSTHRCSGSGDPGPMRCVGLAVDATRRDRAASKTLASTPGWSRPRWRQVRRVTSPGRERVDDRRPERSGATAAVLRSVNVPPLGYAHRAVNRTPKTSGLDTRNF